MTTPRIEEAKLDSLEKPEETDTDTVPLFIVASANLSLYELHHQLTPELFRSKFADVFKPNRRYIDIVSSLQVAHGINNSWSANVWAPRTYILEFAAAKKDLTEMEGVLNYEPIIKYHYHREIKPEEIIRIYPGYALQDSTYAEKMGYDKPILNPITPPSLKLQESKNSKTETGNEEVASMFLITTTKLEKPEFDNLTAEQLVEEYKTFTSISHLLNLWIVDSLEMAEERVCRPYSALYDPCVIEFSALKKDIIRCEDGIFYNNVIKPEDIQIVYFKNRDDELEGASNPAYVEHLKKQRENKRIAILIGKNERVGKDSSVSSLVKNSIFDKNVLPMIFSFLSDEDQPSKPRKPSLSSGGDDC